MATKVAKAAQGGIKAWLLPEINDIKVQLAEIRGDIKSVNTRVDSLGTRIEEMDKRLTGEIRSLDTRLSGEIQGLKESMNVLQRVAILEAKQREFEKKIS